MASRSRRATFVRTVWYRTVHEARGKELVTWHCPNEDLFRDETGIKFDDFAAGARAQEALELIMSCQGCPTLPTHIHFLPDLSLRRRLPLHVLTNPPPSPSKVPLLPEQSLCIGLDT